jgi:mannosylglycerate hydrolase
MKIRTAVTIKRGQRTIEVKVDFHNCIENHRLRVMFPTGLNNCRFSDAGGHFYVDHRPIDIQGPTADLTWPDMATLPQNNFVDISDNRNGFAVLNDSMMEYEVLHDDARTLALTLVRGVKNWICTEARAGSNFPSQKGGQQLGQLSYRYAIYAHAGNWESANVPLVAEFFNINMAMAQTRKHKGILPGHAHSFFAIDNEMMRFSAFKKCEDRETWIVRLYNPTDKEQFGNLVFSMPLKRAWYVNLNEEHVESIAVSGKSLALKTGAHKIVTVELEIWNGRG